ncbi:hypothetical protein QJS10_CPA10g01715 [Acorus calamus]|uniref:Uncharacterized protein n=1 Tax=Acorus calamus TaxID=4465 RepID=A0AAV9E3F4_ACOCL|nr:hypothetical protein QJS10_CPA10g01715 [Acorus calamus]
MTDSLSLSLTLSVCSFFISNFAFMFSCMRCLSFQSFLGGLTPNRSLAFHPSNRIPSSLPSNRSQRLFLRTEARVPDVDVKPEVPQDTFFFFSEDPDFAERMEKYNKYQHDYVRWLKAKYFSKKAWNGASIFDEETQIENEIIRSSRWPCTKSFIDPQLYFEDQNRLAGSTTGGPSSTPEKKPQINKNS